MRSLLILLIFFLGAGVVQAQERVWLGKARLWNNDEIGDRRDRWRTGAYSISYLRGTEWTGQRPEAFGALVEYRLRSEVIAPRSLYAALDPAQRRLVGLSQIGAYSHMQRRGFDISLGVDLVFVGPQTGIAQFQSAIHQALGYVPTPLLGTQLGDAVYPTINLEIAREFTKQSKRGKRLALRPFVEAQAGVETYLRAGADLTIGLSGKGDFLVRDVVTGLRTTAIKGKRARGISFVLGGDIAYVAGSRFLPTALGPGPLSSRARLRAGIYVEEGKASLFYGVTWLGPEFKGQNVGQVLGSVTLRLKF